MSLIAGISGQPAKLIDGVKVDVISELTSGNGVQLQGRKDGVAIPAGMVGEVIQSRIPIASSVSIVDGNGFNVTSITLTTGHWVLSGYITATLSANSGELVKSCNCSISDTSATMARDICVASWGYFSSGVNPWNQFEPRIPLSSVYQEVTAATKTYYLVLAADFTGFTTTKTYGMIQAVRIA